MNNNIYKDMINHIEPDDNMAEKIRSKMISVTETGTITPHVQQKRPVYRVLLTAAVVVIMLTLSITALATTGVLDLSRFYKSIFANTEASPYIVVGDEITITNDILSNTGNSSDLAIKPLAAFISGWMIYVQIEVTVLNDVPLPDTLYILDGDTWINVGEVEISRLDEMSAVLSFTTMGHHVTYLANGETVYYNSPEWEQTDMVILKFDTISSVLPFTDDNVSYNGQWEISVNLDYTTLKRIKPGYIETYYKEFFASVEVSATSFGVVLYPNEGTEFVTRDTYMIESIEMLPELLWAFYDDNGLPAPSIDERIGDVVITLADGTIIKPLQESTSNDNMMASYAYSMEFINPEEIVSIVFLGEELLR